MTLPLTSLSAAIEQRALDYHPVIHPALRDIRWRADGYWARFKDLHFILSAAREQDGKVWLHASVSRRDGKTPTWADLKALKHYCVGDERKAIQVFPPKDTYVNLYEVLHLFSCLDKRGDGLPEFSWDGKTI